VARILFHGCAPWSGSGYGQQTAVWTKKLQEMGHEVYISAFWGLAGMVTQWNGIMILPGFGGQYCSPSLQQHARQVDPDLVLTLGDMWVLDPAVLAGLPIAHWLPSDCRPMSTADRTIAEAAGPQLIAMSRFGQERFKAAGFHALYVPHGISFGTFKPPAEKAALREKAGIGPDTFVIGINGANNDPFRKALAEAMLAFARFIRDRPDSVLALHTGVHQDGGQDLEAIAENLGITDKCAVVSQYRYASGLITAAEMADWYGMLDVLCAATQGEGFGIPIVEAMACGVPVITSKCSSMEELNPDGISVGGQPFWNGTHRAWWVTPSVTGLWQAFGQAHEQRRDVDPVKLRESVAQYEVDAVAEKHMGPVIGTLLERMAVRRGSPRPAVPPLDEPGKG
jgi:glycosyltransferase involved in cell wall biosynthesis